MAIKQVTAIRLTEQEKEIARKMAGPIQGREGGVSYLLRKLLHEEAKRRGIETPKRSEVQK
jgi:hypothetical protein